MPDETERRIEMVQVLTQLQADVQHCTERVNTGITETEKLRKVLYENGLVTQVALNKQGLGRLWKWSGAFMLGLAAWVLRRSL